MSEVVGIKGRVSWQLGFAAVVLPAWALMNLVFPELLFWVGVVGFTIGSVVGIFLSYMLFDFPVINAHRKLEKDERA